jgi:hypothetical protein
VLKGEEALKQYGDNGKYGAVEITLKDSNAPSAGTKAAKGEVKKEIDKASKVIDGKIVANEIFQQLDPNSIHSISVLKDEHAIKKYGDKGKGGVIEITTIKKYQKDTAQTSAPPAIEKGHQLKKEISAGADKQSLLRCRILIILLEARLPGKNIWKDTLKVMKQPTAEHPIVLI